MRIAPPRAGMRWGELFAARSGGEVPDGSRLPKRAEFLYPEYHLVVMRECCHPVSTVMARHIERQLERWPRPRWVTFVDLSGACIRVRAGAIEGLEHSTPETRELWRRFREEWEQEDPPGL